MTTKERTIRKRWQIWWESDVYYYLFFYVNIVFVKLRIMRWLLSFVQWFNFLHFPSSSTSPTTITSTCLRAYVLYANKTHRRNDSMASNTAEHSLCNGIDKKIVFCVIFLFFCCSPMKEVQVKWLAQKQEWHKRVAWRWRCFWCVRESLKLSFVYCSKMCFDPFLRLSRTFSLESFEIEDDEATLEWEMRRAKSYGSYFN